MQVGNHKRKENAVHIDDCIAYKHHSAYSGSANNPLEM